MSYSVFVKNMRDAQCEHAVESVFREFGFPPLAIKGGEILLNKGPGPLVLKKLSERLLALGYGLTKDTRLRAVTRTKQLLEQLLETDYTGQRIRLSAYLGSAMPYEYHYLSRLFSEAERTTIEKYFIRLRVRKVSQMIGNCDHSLKDISYRFGYSSPAHMTTQFKQVRGITPSQYRIKICGSNRKKGNNVK